jgi:hypothetical protein
MSWARGAAAVVGAIAVVALNGGTVASAKGPCGKMGSCARVIEGVHVSQTTASGATLEAVLNGEVEYKFLVRLVVPCGSKEKCEPQEAEVLSSGRSEPGMKEQATVTVEAHELSARSKYVFWVEATREGETESSKHLKFRTKK